MAEFADHFKYTQYNDNQAPSILIQIIKTELRFEISQLQIT